MPTKRDQQTPPRKTGDPGSRPKSTRRPQRPATPGPSGSVQAGEVMTLAELKRRLNWGEHTIRQARKAGLRLIPWGRAKYALGSDILTFFERLAEQQAGGGNGQAAAEGAEVPERDGTGREGKARA